MHDFEKDGVRLPQASVTTAHPTGQRYISPVMSHFVDGMRSTAFLSALPPSKCVMPSNV